MMIKGHLSKKKRGSLYRVSGKMSKFPNTLIMHVCDVGARYAFPDLWPKAPSQYG